MGCGTLPTQRTHLSVELQHGYFHVCASCCRRYRPVVAGQPNANGQRCAKHCGTNGHSTQCLSAPSQQPLSLRTGGCLSRPAPHLGHYQGARHLPTPTTGRAYKPRRQQQTAHNLRRRATTRLLPAPLLAIGFISSK